MVPGGRGVLAPARFRIANLDAVRPQPPALRVRGLADVIVSDTSLFDLAYLGSIGAVPGWPGADVMPPQPQSPISGFARTVRYFGHFWPHA